MYLSGLMQLIMNFIGNLGYFVECVTDGVLAFNGRFVSHCAAEMLEGRK